jgi:hypothetical protein
MFLNAENINVAMIFVITICFLGNLWTLFQAYQDQAMVIIAHKDHALQHLASANIREEIFRVAKQIIFLSATFVSLYPNIRMETKLYAFEVSIIAVSIIMAINAYLARIARRAVNLASGVNLDNKE